MYPPLCDFCEQEVLVASLHEYCHLNIPLPKTYQDYQLEAVETNISIIARYSAPSYAKPPEKYRKSQFSSGTDAIFNLYTRRKKRVS